MPPIGGSGLTDRGELAADPGSADAVDAKEDELAGEVDLGLLPGDASFPADETPRASAPARCGLRRRGAGVSGIADPKIEAYAELCTTPPTNELTSLQLATMETLSFPSMLSGPVEGRLLELLVHAVQARQVLELGTFSGFSALSMAAGLPPGGRIVTCEISAENAAFARKAIDASRFADRIELREGPALATIASLDGPFDLVFIDADKPGYVHYFEAVLPKLSKHGLIVVDNTLWSGRVLDDEDDSAARALTAFNAPGQRPASGLRDADRPRRTDLGPAEPQSVGRARRPRGGPGGRTRGSGACDTQAGSVRFPFRETSVDARGRPRPWGADRGRRDPGDAGDPAGAARGGRQLQGRQGLHVAGPRAVSGGGRARAAEPGSAGREDRPRGVG